MDEVIVNGHVFQVTYNDQSMVTKIIVPAYTDPNTGQPLTIYFTPPIPYALSLLETLDAILFP